MTANVGDDARLFSKTEAAAWLGISERTLDRLREQRRIGWTQTGTTGRGKIAFRLVDLENFRALNTTLMTVPAAPTPSTVRKPAPNAASRRRSSAPGTDVRSVG